PRIQANPRTTDPAGTRTAAVGGARVTLLLPQSKKPEPVVRTTQASPTLFWRQVGAADRQVVLAVRPDDGPGQLLRVSRLVKKNDRQVRAVDLAACGAVLELGRVYEVVLEIVEDPDNRDKNPHVRGWIKRVEARDELSSALREAGPVGHAAVYAERGLWLDALGSVWWTKRLQPKEPYWSGAWAELIGVADLVKGDRTASDK
ncbi:MAG: DUF928 domain-containing protein, partial [Phycisphaerae bacterium]|nr:DUF928 domain-containing protein [Phycisphaerae bacterium]